MNAIQRPLSREAAFRKAPNAGTIAGPHAASTARQNVLMAITLTGILFNAILAFLGAHGVPVSMPLVVVCEVTVLGSALWFVLHDGLSELDALPLLFLLTAAIITFMMSIAAERPYVDFIRNVLIIAAFTMLGARCSMKMLRTIFLVVTVLTLSFLLLEIISLPTYSSIFRPGDYLEKTRGYVQPEFYLDIGLSKGTIAYRGRFSFGIFDGPRTSSIFLEQVGINCFTIVVLVYLLTMWQNTTRSERGLAIATIILILASNNARMASILVAIFAMGYWIFPRLPRLLLPFVPVLLLSALWTIFQFRTPFRADDFMGRLSVTYTAMSELNTMDLLFGNRRMLGHTFDSGYAYLMASGTVFGGLAYYLYLVSVVPMNGARERRCGWSAAIYIFVWLLVGGTGSFSIKTAPLLWLLIGFVRAGGLTDGVVPVPATPTAIRQTTGVWKGRLAYGRR